ncbi:hypothetical protein AVL60_02040 [Kocuria palustris]|nr:hypothetical protein AVL60_02040 [Kocuria palustris]
MASRAATLIPAAPTLRRLQREAGLLEWSAVVMVWAALLSVLFMTPSLGALAMPGTTRSCAGAVTADQRAAAG